MNIAITISNKTSLLISSLPFPIFDRLKIQYTFNAQNAKDLYQLLFGNIDHMKKVSKKSKFSTFFGQNLPIS